MDSDSILEQILKIQDMVSAKEADKKEEQLDSMMGIYQTKGGGAEE